MRQGNVLSSVLFLVIDEAINKGKTRMKQLNLGYWKMKQTKIIELVYADDMAVFVAPEENFQNNFNVL